MNYTDAATIRASMGGQETLQDSVLTGYAAKASRMIDHYCAQTDDPGAVDYFTQETVVNELLTNGKIDAAGHLVCYPHKYGISSVTALAWRTDPRAGWLSADTLDAVIIQGASVVYYGELSWIRGRPLFVKISYVGGMGADIAHLNPLLVDNVTVVAIRKYKEERSGMSDVVGVVELGTVQYSKGMPASVINDLAPFMRVAPWT